MNKYTGQKTYVNKSKDNKYFSIPLVNINSQARDVLIKNYIIAPGLKVIKY